AYSTARLATALVLRARRRSQRPDLSSIGATSGIGPARLRSADAGTRWSNSTLHSRRRHRRSLSQGHSQLTAGRSLLPAGRIVWRHCDLRDGSATARAGTTGSVVGDVEY